MTNSESRSCIQRGVSVINIIESGASVTWPRTTACSLRSATRIALTIVA